MTRLITLAILIVYAHFLYAQDLIDFGAVAYWRLLLLPHQIAISDCIFTGMVITNNADSSCSFSVDECIYGSVVSTNITIRRLDTSYDPSTIATNKRYLVFAFTNNWGRSEKVSIEDYILALSDWHNATNTPTTTPPFKDYMVLSAKESALDFDRFTVRGTNYWPELRSFITNYIHATRFLQDNRAAYSLIEPVRNSNAPMRLPPEFRTQLLKYDILYFDAKTPVAP